MFCQQNTSLKGISFISMMNENGAQINVQRDGHCLHYLKVEVQPDGNMKVFIANGFDNGVENCNITEIPLDIS